MVADFFSLLLGCVAMFAAFDRKGLYFALGVGLLLAAVCWVACSYYSKLWNKRYQVRLGHHLLCLVAALLTLAFSVIYSSLKYTKEAAYASVLVWVGQVATDAPWATATFGKAYDKVKKLGVEDFTNYPAPPVGRLIPTTTNASILAAASTYAKEASRHFDVARPFLSLILHGQTDVPTLVLDADVKNYFATVAKTYPAPMAVALVGKEIKKGLDEQVPRVVVIARRFAIGGFALAQLIPFMLVGLAAYKDIKVKI